jgi:mRNA interferase MazF
MSKQPKRGEIWLLDWSPSRGSEQAGFRPALVVQTNSANGNPAYPNTIVLALSTKGKPVPFHVAVSPNPQNGLTEASFIKCEQVLTVSKDRLLRKLGEVDQHCTYAIDRALRLVLEIE